MTNDGDALFRAICEQPEEDTPRLVYADWLDENGRPERAEFIRLQCEAWNLCPAYPTITEARTRASVLLKRHGDAWYAELPLVPAAHWGDLFVRGFIDSAETGRLRDVGETLSDLFAAAPLRHLNVMSLRPGQLGELLGCPLLGRLVTLRLPGTLGNEEARLLTEREGASPRRRFTERSSTMFTPEDKAFIRTILANPAELTSWLVYADWLDEHDNPEHAEFLRLEVRRGQLRDTDAEWPVVEKRLRELRGSLNQNWVAVFDRPEIENCEPAFKFKCPKRWESLKVLDRPDVRHCPACDKSVYYCHTLPDAQDHARDGHCVAVRLDVLRYSDDLKPHEPDDTDDLFADRRMVLGEFDADYRPRERRPWWKFW